MASRWQDLELFQRIVIADQGLGPSMMSQKYKNNVLTVDSQTGEFDEDDVDFTTVKQLRVWQIETVTHIGGALPHWNMSVQFWMYHYVSQKFQLDNSGLCLRMCILFGSMYVLMYVSVTKLLGV